MKYHPTSTGIDTVEGNDTLSCISPWLPISRLGDRLWVSKQVVTITGASSGIGRATAKVVAAITAGGGNAVAKETDVRRRDDFEALVAFAVERDGRLDVVINCAG